MADTKKAEGVAKEKKKGGFRETVLLLVLGVGIALLLQAFVVGSFYIPSVSMENTLLVNDRVFVNKLAGKPERGDIVVFKGWNGEDTIKRVIGIGGDKVVCCDKQKRITVNGTPLDEKSYLYPDDFASGDDFNVTVPAGKLWLMGDHRSASADSRAHMEEPGGGFISENDVIGKAVLRYWPLSRGYLFSRPDIFDKVK
ncbi:Signal peptidase I [[Actinomadura] parvosata subsp. kistnae]|uniref:Signal peptidase I n=2 Tax=Nonomuraea TaxID=83681 RepID=A0A1V0A7A6_9ACTN|nr:MULTISPECIES: signal peptidase I [unclassified Nonomuraea]AQZ66060.1 signal peptidase I [Nonomuraea sp. ATCC 55076]NJP95693.1 signal peptidase I [Nonomuraea sp. FMUSA5-5]SPL97542.1 Signal peptidase I [Actinomadura parvosata subsp. kistnae]